MLAVAQTDSTFERRFVREREVWSGKCLHCNTTLLLGLDGEPISRVTLEHIVPRTAGGTEDVANLGLACARCNHLKGARHDQRLKHDARAQEVVAKLLLKRRERWRTAEP